MIAGDIFHSIRPSNSVITFAFRQIKRITSKLKIPVIIIAGNHDSPKRVESGSLLRLFQEIDLVYISDQEIEIFNFPDLELSVTCLPHNVLEQKEKWTVRADDKYKHNILLTHAQIGSEFFSDFGGANLNFKQFVAGEWDYIAMGHIHVYQQIGDNIVYPGAIEHTSKNIWAEAEYNKGFVVVDLPEKRKTFYSLTTPREVIALPPVDLSGLEPETVMIKLSEVIESIPGGLDGKIIRLQLYNLSRNIYALLDHRQIKSWKSRALNIMIDVRPPELVAPRVSVSDAKRKTIESELDEFIGAYENLHTDKKALSKKMASYFKELAE